jgi:hypothetical protein
MVNLKPSDIPVVFPVRPLRPGDVARERVTDNACGLSWDDAVGTTWTPAPAGRCPFEYFHRDEEEELTVPLGCSVFDAVILLSSDRRILGVFGYIPGEDVSDLIEVGMDDARRPHRVEVWRVGDGANEFVVAAERTQGSPSHWHEAPR